MIMRKFHVLVHSCKLAYFVYIILICCLMWVTVNLEIDLNANGDKCNNEIVQHVTTDVVDNKDKNLVSCVCMDDTYSLYLKFAKFIEFGIN